MTTHRRLPRFTVALVVAACACTGAYGGASTVPVRSTTNVSRAMSPLRGLPLPPPVQIRPTPEARLADPAFDPLPGAHADFGTLGGMAYQIERPRHWNGRLLLFMHGFEEFAPEARVSAPDFRRYLIGQGWAWGASSFSSTSLIPGRAADETAALWDYFARRHGRPTWTYVSGLSMGGMATHIAAERYGNRFDGALGLCGAAGTLPGLSDVTDFFIAGAYVAGVTQAEFDATSNIGDLVERRIRPALREPRAHARFENIMIDLTGGPRAFAREGFHLEEETSWRRAVIVVTTQLAPPRVAPYRLSRGNEVSSDDFNRKALRLPTNPEGIRTFTAGNETTGHLQLPLLTLHSTGDGQVPIDEALTLRDRVRRAGMTDRLVQRVIRDPSHCGFTTGESEAGLDALVGWVEHGRKPKGTNLAVSDLRRAHPTFEQLPRPGTPEAARVTGARERVVVSGRASLDGAAFDARWLGAVVRRHGLATACNLTLPPVDAGRFEITVVANAESRGCGGPGTEILLWAFVNDKILYSTSTVPWPTNGRAAFDAHFSTSAPRGVAPTTTEFSGEVYRRDGRRLPPGTQARRLRRHHPLRCGVGEAHRQLLWVHPVHRGSRCGARLPGGRTPDAADRRPPGDRDSGQRARWRAVARPDRRVALVGRHRSCPPARARAGQVRRPP